MKIGISESEIISCLVPTQKGMEAPMKPVIPIANKVCQYFSFYKYYRAEIRHIGQNLVKIKNGILKYENIGCLVPTQKGLRFLLAHFFCFYSYLRFNPKIVTFGIFFIFILLSFNRKIVAF